MSQGCERGFRQERRNKAPACVQSEGLAAGRELLEAGPGTAVFFWVEAQRCSGGERRQSEQDLVERHGGAERDGDDPQMCAHAAHALRQILPRTGRARCPGDGWSG